MIRNYLPKNMNNQKRSALRQGWAKNSRKARSVYKYMSTLSGFFAQDWPKMGVPCYVLKSLQ